MPKGERRSRKRGERRGMAAGIHRRNAMMAWSALILIGSFLVLGFFVWSWLSGQMERKAAAGTGGPAIQSHRVSKFKSPSQEEAIALVKKALEARDPLNVMAYFRTGEAEPGAIIRFLAGMERNDGPIRDYQWLSSMDANGLLLEGVLVVSDLDGKPRNRLAMLTPDDTGIWKIDYEAFARVTRPPWDRILAEDGGQGVVRVILAKDTYFNGPFRDDSRWSCYGMASPDMDQILIGYCRKGSPQDEAMQRMFPKEPDEAVPAPTRQNKIIRATLQLDRPSAAEERQFEITRVLAEDWVVSDEPFDRSDG
ncbi:MAG TPA: hypothetical protein VLO11_03275 [Luteolibacter sp.]|nr:hypothetical protein [Luteolibacter sp.]